MKRVAFAWVTEIIDFDSYYDAISYLENNQDKGWKFRDFHPKEYAEKPYNHDVCYHVKMARYLEKFINHTDADGMTYAFGDKDVEEYWTVEVQKPYGKYNCGW